MRQAADVARFASWLLDKKQRRDGVGETARFVQARPHAGWLSFSELRTDARASGECSQAAIDSALIAWRAWQREQDTPSADAGTDLIEKLSNQLRNRGKT